MAALWAKELRRREEHRHLTASDILDMALRDVLGGSIDWKDLKKAAADAGADGEADAPVAEADEKPKKSKDKD